MTPFALDRTPLEEGTSLIEASAGTGKTHTIAGIFLRLLLESVAAGRPMHVDEILVVTYTEAATEELRDRIRKRLAAAAAELTQGHSSDLIVAELLDRHPELLERWRASLILALNCFDLAPIFTIHGFCQRALKDRAFESGALFDAEILPDQSALLREIADDFWRRQFYEADPLHVAVGLRGGMGPGKFLELARACLSHANLKILTRANGKASAALAGELGALFDSARRLWGRDRGILEDIFAKAADWGNRPYNDPETVRAAFIAMSRLFDERVSSAGQLVALEFFAANAIASKARKKRIASLPRHEFFDVCEQFGRCEADFVTALQREFLEYARIELRARKDKLKRLSYDDLLTRLQSALNGSGGVALASELRRKYRVALIDEFQDTDPVQWDIFRTLFAPAGDGPKARQGGQAAGPGLYLIGDPKQAIYGFRGADIFTYMEASEAAHRRFTLGENWRSESGLVRAVNTVFGLPAKPFVFDRIEFHPVEARGAANDQPLAVNGLLEPPLHIWFCRREKKTIPKGAAEEQLSKATAAEITRLLNGNVTLGGRPLRPQDIAVLTLTHKQAALVQEALRAVRVPSVQQTQASVFGSPEASQILRLLSGIAAPWNEPFVRAALTTDLLGLSGTTLGAMEPAAWTLWRDRFREWFELWVSRGFITMFRRVLDGDGVRARLLARPDGERALTNVLHLAEILHEAALREKLGAGGLLQWLATRVEDQDAAEEHQLRLERDENAVQLVTVHKSKGLQYEVVFAPFCWRGSELKRRNAPEEDQEVLFHHASTRDLIRDLGPEPAAENVRLAKLERLAENVRQLYVALTRARHRCYLAWGAFSGAESSAPAWLLHRGAEWPRDFAGLSDEQMLADLETLARASREAGCDPAIAVCEVPEAPGEIYQSNGRLAPVIAVREFKGHVPRDWRVASFSGLAAGQREEAPDRDPAKLPPGVVPPVPAPATGIFAFPRGSKAGTCLHAIFEKLDFTTAGGTALEELAREQLKGHGFSPGQFEADVVSAVRRTLDVPLDPARPGLKLARVSKAERVVELEFCIPLRPFAMVDLMNVFTRHGCPAVQGDFPEQLGRLTFSPVRGFIKGFIDLVFRFDGRFWLVDWKSNWLGNQCSDYGPGALRSEMASRLYVLQYHLYVLALDRWLRLRMPGYDYARDFGGAFYVFLRGIDPLRPELGLFRDRPAPELIRALETTLLLPQGA